MRFHSSKTTAVAGILAAVSVMLGPTRGQCQGPDPDGKPTFGSVTLKSGFEPDPFTRQLTAGGPVRTSLGGITVHVAGTPDFRLNYTAGQFPLIFRVESARDTTLLISLPDGTWIADDDSGGKQNPQIKLNKPKSGRYDIFVGMIGQETAPATLTITEATGGAAKPNPTGKNVPLPGLDPTYGSVTLKSGFSPDPFTKSLKAGGGILTNLGGVNTHVAREPDFRVNYTAGIFPLTFRATSSGDTTLLVNLPNGQWMAVDDSPGSHDPVLRVEKPASGQYDIFVGTIGEGSVAATLSISEISGGVGTNPAPNTTPISEDPVPTLNPTFGSVTLKSGFTPDPFTKNVTAGGPLTTKLGGVTAHIAKAPDFRLNYTSGGRPLKFSVSAGKDTTLLINLPNGQWIADDDGGGNHNPLIRLNQPASGRYDIYVGTFGTDAVPATLSISELK